MTTTMTTTTTTTTTTSEEKKKKDTSHGLKQSRGLSSSDSRPTLMLATMSSSSSSATSSPLQQQQQLQQQKIRLQDFAAQQELHIQFPARVVASTTSSTTTPPPSSTSWLLRTDEELIQHKLLEAGVLYEVPVPLADTVRSLQGLVQDLQRSDCFHSVQVQLGTVPPAAVESETVAASSTSSSSPSSSPQHHSLTVLLEEKKWYKLHIGAGLKQDAFWSSSSSSSSTTSALSSSSSSSTLLVPRAELEATVGLRNVAGVLDQTLLQAAVDTTGLPTLSLTHERPWYTVLPNPWRNQVLQGLQGTQYTALARVGLDTRDYQATRSYQEHVRSLSFQVANRPHVGHYLTMPVSSSSSSSTTTTTTTTTTSSTASQDEAAGETYRRAEWSCSYRDLIPRRHPDWPYHWAASPEICAQSVSPTLLHMFTLESYHRRGLDHPLQPRTGHQRHVRLDLATPPGDVGYFKAQTTWAYHVPLSSLGTSAWSVHGLASLGWLRPLTWGGLTAAAPPRAMTASDRFHLGGPGQFPGFMPEGIGPKGSTSTSSSSSSPWPTPTTIPLTAPSDSLGGDFYYRATLQASWTPSTTPHLAHGHYHTSSSTTVLEWMQSMGLQFFVFGTVGTCGQLPMIGPGHHRSSSSSSSSSLWTTGQEVLASSRCSCGLGVRTAALGPRLECTYAWPLRYGPRDHRRHWQFGLNLSM